MCYFLIGSPFLRGERREGRQGGLPLDSGGVMNDLMEACFDIGILTGVDSAELFDCLGVDCFKGVHIWALGDRTTGE